MPYYQPYLYYNNGAMPDMLAQMRQTSPQMSTTPTPPQSGNGIVWVQGEASAKSYPVAPNSTVMLLDSESNTFYLKTSDASGMPLPLRVFDYKERVQGVPKAPAEASSSGFNVDLDKFVTKDELNEILASLPLNAMPKKTEKKTKGETDNG